MNTDNPIEKALFLSQESSSQLAYQLEKADGYNRFRDEPLLESELREIAKEANAFNLKVLAFGLRYAEAKYADDYSVPNL